MINIMVWTSMLNSNLFQWEFYWDLKGWSLPHFTWPGGCLVLLEPFCNGGCWRIPSSLRQCSFLNNSECHPVFSTPCSWQDVLESQWSNVICPLDVRHLYIWRWPPTWFHFESSPSLTKFSNCFLHDAYWGPFDFLGIGNATYIFVLQFRWL